MRKTQRKQQKGASRRRRARPKPDAVARSLPDAPNSLRAQLASVANPLELLEGLFTNSPVPYAVFTAQGQCLLTNPAYRAMFGRAPPPEYNVLQDEIAQQRGISGLIRRAFAGETVTTPTIWYDPKELTHINVTDANRVAMSCTFFPFSGPHGRVSHVAIAYKDLTGELQARESTERERDLLRAIVEQSGDGIIVSDADGVLRIFNPAAERQHGVTKQEVSAPQWGQTYGLLDMEGRPLPLPETPLFRAVNGETVRNARWLVKRPDGRIRTLEGTATPLTTLDGTPAGGMLVARDVTEQRRLEDALKANEEQFRSLADSIPHLAWMADHEGSIFWFNERWYEYTGSTLDSARSWGWRAVQDPAETARVEASFSAALRSGMPWEDEIRLRGSDGTFRWFLSRARPVRDSSGSIVRWFGTHTDTNDQRRMAAELREAVSARDEFLSVASHELKSPLTPLSLRLQALERLLDEQPESPLSNSARRYVETGRKQLKRLSELVGDLLDVSRIDAGRLKLEREPIDLSLLVREVVSRHAPEAARVGSKLELRVMDGVVATLDQMRVEQVVTNLMDNALKYGANKPVTLELGVDSGRAVLTVRDHGIGIEPGNLARIFERFERAVSERHYGGLGLGLYITRQLVEAHGGNIQVQSELGEGSTFTVAFPLEEPPTESRAGQTA
jgi:PAS domain S-box-containing protein